MDLDDFKKRNLEVFEQSRIRVGKKQKKKQNRDDLEIRSFKSTIKHSKFNSVLGIINIILVIINISIFVWQVSKG